MHPVFQYFVSLPCFLALYHMLAVREGNWLAVLREAHRLKQMECEPHTVMASASPLDEVTIDNKQTGLSADSFELSKTSTKLNWCDSADEDWLSRLVDCFCCQFSQCKWEQVQNKMTYLEIHKLKLWLFGVLNFLILMAPNNLLKYGLLLYNWSLDLPGWFFS